MVGFIIADKVLGLQVAPPFMKINGSKSAESCHSKCLEMKVAIFCWRQPSILEFVSARSIELKKEALLLGVLFSSCIV